MTRTAELEGAYLPIADYALIGDCRAAALVSRMGSIDWLCWPRFNSPSLFGAILDSRHGGTFAIRPSLPFRAERHYVPDSNVLETTFHASGGAAVLRDCMPVQDENEKKQHLAPSHELLREIEGIEGELDLEIVYAPRPDYGRRSPRLRHRGGLGVWSDTGTGALVLLADVPLQIDAQGHTASASVRLRAGERRVFALTFSEDAPAVVPLLGDAAHRRIERTVGWWQAWAGRCSYRGTYRDDIVRSALTLKMLTYAPSGALLAAPTTSLPEAFGGVRNWDYRYCWLRDASFTMRTLISLGYREEAEAFLGWLLQSTRLTQPRLQVVYDVYGEAHLPERTLSEVEGYGGARPVRVGNDAHGQMQLDVYGEVVDAAARFCQAGGTFDRQTAAFLSGVGETVCKLWREPDDGIWEARSGRMHYTHSKVMCWVALDRLISLHRTGHVGVDLPKMTAERAVIASEIEAHGYSERIGSYTRVFDGDEVDAALIALPLYGYVDAAAPRMRSTLARIKRLLGTDDLMYRYHSTTEDGLPHGEGAFGICSFWAVECMARAGDHEDATIAFERLLRYGNEVGLFSEEIDPGTGAMLGNFPQAFTHIGLVNAALTLAELTGEHGPRQSADMSNLSVEDRL